MPPRATRAACLAAALLRAGALQIPMPSNVSKKRDLVLMHIPYNFGHTVEKVAMFRQVASVLDIVAYTMSTGDLIRPEKKATWDMAKKYLQPGGEVWGHFNPDLQVMNNKTNCSMFFSPQKYWPEDLAQHYFGKKTVFGMLRDPYERLVAFFRGNLKGYGGNYEKYHATCDVNGAVKEMMKTYIAGGNPFREGCTFLPQAEYFDGPHGIKLAVDNRRFPTSMNEVFKEHGYRNMNIQEKDILHVATCNDAWAGDLDAEAKQLVRKVYARDFELLCQHFGYCDETEDVCIAGVPQMCPAKVQAQMTAKLANFHRK